MDFLLIDLIVGIAGSKSPNQLVYHIPHADLKSYDLCITR